MTRTRRGQRKEPGEHGATGNAQKPCEKKERRRSVTPESVTAGKDPQHQGTVCGLNTLFQEQVTPDAGSTPATLAGPQPGIARCEALTVWPASRKHRTKRMLREMAAFLGDTLFPELAPADVPPVRVGANWIWCPSGTVPRRCEGTGSTPACQQVRLLLAHGAITPSTPICAGVVQRQNTRLPIWIRGFDFPSPAPQGDREHEQEADNRTGGVSHLRKTWPDERRGAAFHPRLGRLQDVPKVHPLDRQWKALCGRSMEQGGN